jgi:hypothetical protein
MENTSTWQILLAGIVALLVILWFRPGIRVAMERSRNAKKDWKAVLIPLGLVVLFVLLLMSIV